MLKIAMLGKWHVHAEGYAREFNSQSDSAVTCVWDSDPERGASWAKSLGVPFFADIDELFENAEFDATCVCSETNRHKDLMLKAAEKQKHIFTEKAASVRALLFLSLDGKTAQFGLLHNYLQKFFLSQIPGKRS